MLKRKKRIPYDPPGSKKRRKSPGKTRRSDQIFLSRRMFLLKSAIVGGFATLTGRLGYMQLVQGKQYRTDAQQNVITWTTVKPARGLIFDRAGRPLAENQRTWSVSIIPTELPDKGTPEFELIRDTLITALRLPDSLIIEQDAVPADARDTVYTRVGHLLGDKTDKDTQSTLNFIAQQAKINYVVAIEKELSADQAARFNAVIQELPGVSVVNYFDYLVTNYRYQSTPIIVKTDVSRDVAMKLEANRLQLPGVVLDDNTLVRRYPGGPSMSHILGYVGIISDDDLNDPSNLKGKDSNGNPLYAEYKPDDVIGKNGLERRWESLLKGSKGGYWSEINGSGVVQQQLAQGATPAVNGRNLQLTVDLELQNAFTLALKEMVEFSTSDRLDKAQTEEAKKAITPCLGGAVVAMSPKTGEIFGMVSYPQYDNQLFVTGLSQRKMDEYNNDPTTPLNDRAYAGNFQPGSTIKPFMSLAALKEKKITADTTFFCSGAIRVPWTWDETKGDNYLCWVHANENDQHGNLTVVEAIEQSCDVFFYNAGAPKQRPEGATEDLHYRDYYWKSGTTGDKHYFRGLGIKLIQKNLGSRFWFGTPTGIELPAEAKGLVPNEQYKLDNFNDYWSSGDTINSSIGQGYFLASPLQMATNTTALATGGTIRKPKIVQAQVDDDCKPIQTFDSTNLRSYKWDPDHLALVREGMRRVVNEPTGTAYGGYQAPDYDVFVSKWPLMNPDGLDKITIAGKTGTAETGVQNSDGSYSKSHAWFTCYAPIEDPEIVVTVFLEDGGEGATYAVPVADKAMRAYFELTEKRPRGLVLRKDKQPVTVDLPADGVESNSGGNGANGANSANGTAATPVATN
jgi:penicillin-binding protein 2